jgi:hypothetical protein
LVINDSNPSKVPRLLDRLWKALCDPIPQSIGIDPQALGDVIDALSRLSPRCYMRQHLVAQRLVERLSLSICPFSVAQNRASKALDVCLAHARIFAVLDRLVTTVMGEELRGRGSVWGDLSILSEERYVGGEALGGLLGPAPDHYRIAAPAIFSMLCTIVKSFHWALTFL